MEQPYDIILIGPIEGVIDHKARFAVAYASLREEFYRKNGRIARVWNPAEMEQGMTRAWYMWRCFEAILGSPSATVYALDGWHNSGGAGIEHALAEYCGMSIRYQETC